MKKLNTQNIASDTLDDFNLLSSNEIDKIKIRANELLSLGLDQSAKTFFEKIVSLDPLDINSKYSYARLIDDGTHKQMAKSRDLLMEIIEQCPDIFNAHDVNLQLIRKAAYLSFWVGPQEKAAELFIKLAPLSGWASDYYQLAEILAQSNFLSESIEALKKAVLLDPITYDNEINRETIKLAKLNLIQENQKSKLSKNKIGRYPSTADFLGDFQSLIKNHVANNLLKEDKFICKHTKFFTMGSCFARSISKTLIKQGFTSNHMEITEFVNTTFANRAFVDWLTDHSDNISANARFKELLPPHWSAENTIQIIRDSDVFIMTLGVAPAFFDRKTGEFILPRPSSLNSRMLAEQYNYRTTTVQENVDNVLYLIKFIRSLSSKIKIIITVSPIPMAASFEYESCIQADCLSKSIMRLVAHEVVNNSKIANILYWPSFEIFRWGGSQSSNYFAVDDGASGHVSEDKVLGTTEAFIDIFKI